MVELYGKQDPMTADQIQKIFYDMRDEQEKMMKNTSAFKKFVKDEQERITNRVVELMAINMKTSLLESILEEVSGEAEGLNNLFSTDSFAYDVYRKRTGEYGRFIEREFLGLSGTDNEARADIEELNTEIKTTTGADYLLVGTVTVHGIDVRGKNIKEELRERNRLQTVGMLKMIKKMSNLLYILVGESGGRTSDLMPYRGRTTPDRRVHIGFKAIILYTTLYLKKVEELLTGQQFKFVKVEKTTDPMKVETKDENGNPVTVSQIYRVIIMQSKEEPWKSISKLTELYLAHFDLLADIRGKRITARAFFGTIKKMRMNRIEI